MIKKFLAQHVMFPSNLRLIISKQYTVTTPHAEFVQLLLQHQNILHKVCRAYCPAAEDRRDLFQEIALQLWRAYPQFRAESKETTWMYRIALNVAISQVRRRSRPPTDELTPAFHELADPPASEAAAERTAELYEAIYTLSDVEKALVLLYFDDKTTEEIADVTGITPNNVRVKMHRIREKLKVRMQTSSDPRTYSNQ